MIELLKIVIIFVISIQVLLAFVSAYELRVLPRKFNIPISTQVNVARMMEAYSRVFSSINIKVNDRNKGVSRIKGRLLLVNRDKVYRADLYSNITTLWNINLTQEKFLHYQMWEVFQVIGFMLECLLLAFAFIPGLEFLVFIGAGVSILLIVLSYIFLRKLNQLGQETVVQAYDLLDLDEYEQGIAVKLVSRLESGAFVYPITSIKWLIGFINPF